MTTRQPGQPPNARQKNWNAKLPGAKTNDLRAARQIAQSRRFVYDGRQESHCVCCGAPRDRRAHPVCNSCTTKRLAGLR